MDNESLVKTINELVNLAKIKKSDNDKFNFGQVRCGKISYHIHNIKIH